MQSALKLLIVVIGSTLLSACFTPKSYVDQTFSRVDYADIQRVSPQLKIKVLATFKRDGEPLPQFDSQVTEIVERTLRSTGIGVPDEAGTDGIIKLSINNIGDVGIAAAKGFGTGLTFGLIGSLVTDGYKMNASITVNHKGFEKDQYEHALHTAIGNTSIPGSGPVMSPDQAFAKVTEELVLKFLADAQKYGVFSSKGPRPEQSKESES